MQFSVIVPVYNVEDYLKVCLESLIAQTYRNLEIILVEDGSTDSSLKICRAYEKKDQRIRVFHQENQGVSRARNFGVGQALGDYILFVDGDDFIETDACEKLAKALEEKGCPDILLADAMYYFPDGTTKPKRRKMVWQEAADGKSFWIENQKRSAMSSSPVVNICKREFLQKGEVSFPPGRYHEDVYWVAKAYFYAEKVAYVPLSFYFHVMRAGSTTHSKNPKRCQDIFWIGKELEIFFSDHTEDQDRIFYKEYCCYLYGTAIHSAVLQNLSIRKVFTKEERRQIRQKLWASSQWKYKLLSVVLRFRLWKPYGVFYWLSRRKKQC